jgi:hypothetical protein
VPCASVKAYFQASGGFNGGTIATFIYSQQSRLPRFSLAAALSPNEQEADVAPLATRCWSSQWG